MTNMVCGSQKSNRVSGSGDMLLHTVVAYGIFLLGGGNGQFSVTILSQCKCHARVSSCMQI